MKLLNNIGVVGAVLAAIADIIFVIIMVLGVQIQAELRSIIIFAVVNALVGILISILLRYQGQKYAEVENEDLCKQYYNKRIKEKKYVSMGKWMTIKAVEDILIKGVTTSFSMFGIIYISITGSKNPIQILITIATLVLFACFGLIGMNSAYTRFYNIQVPYMNLKLEERERESRKKGTTKRDNKHASDRSKGRDKTVVEKVDNSSEKVLEGLADRGCVPILSCSVDPVSTGEIEVKIDDRSKQ